jgi:predicted nuclease with TOPRIM domain
MKMKDVDIKVANLEEEVKRLLQKNSKLEGKLGRLRANLMSLEFPREHQDTVDKFFQAVERSIVN